MSQMSIILVSEVGGNSSILLVKMVVITSIMVSFTMEGGVRQQTRCRIQRGAGGDDICIVGESSHSVSKSQVPQSASVPLSRCDRDLRYTSHATMCQPAAKVSQSDVRQQIHFQYISRQSSFSNKMCPHLIQACEYCLLLMYFNFSIVKLAGCCSLLSFPGEFQKCAKYRVFFKHKQRAQVGSIGQKKIDVREYFSMNLL